MIKVVSYQFKAPDQALVINTTSRSDNWSRGLSPFFCGPVVLYDQFVAQNVENAWQYSKVYEYYLEDDGSVGERYFKWASDGWDSKKAERYPMGKGSVPLFTYWDGLRLSYTEARKKVYIPVYAEAVQKTDAFQQLKKLYETGQDLYLRDFDAHSLEPGTFDYWALWDNAKIKVGHGYVLAMLLEGLI